MPSLRAPLACCVPIVSDAAPCRGEPRPPPDGVHWQPLDIGKAQRARALGQRPVLVWFTGLPAAGKSSIANRVERRLSDAGRHSYLLDGDNLRHGLNQDLGFSPADRSENLRRVGEVARLMLDAGLIVLAALVSPSRSDRERIRALLAPGEFIEVFVDTPLALAEARDPKGLYRRARRGELPGFTGIDAPYEAPERPALRIDTACSSIDAAADAVMQLLHQQAVMTPPPLPSPARHRP
jgi:bifunctional enzyme CysN/CysC